VADHYAMYSTYGPRHAAIFFGVSIAFALSGSVLAACSDSDDGPGGGSGGAGATSTVTGGAEPSGTGGTGGTGAAGAAGGATSCAPCVGALPELGDTVVRELPTLAGDPCDGVCIKTSAEDGDPRCFYGSNEGDSCDDHGAKGLSHNDVDPDVATENFELAEGSSTGDPVPDKKHRVWLAESGPTKDELFVFFGGTGGSCAIHKWIGTAAAAAGYRSLCLAYPNRTALSEYCQDELMADPDSNCYYDVRSEMLTGEDTTDHIVVGPLNSIEGRLRATLEKLDELYPDGGFDAYLDGDTIQWDQIVVSGFSQGGGYAGIIATKYEVARAVYFSKSVSGDGEVSDISCTSHEECQDAGFEYCEKDFGYKCATTWPTNWINEPRATPVARNFGIVHAQESGFYHSPEGWEIWGMDGCGALMPIADAPADFGCRQMFTSNLEPNDGSNSFHGSMGSDGNMARDADGYPLHQQAWLYMMLAELNVGR